MKEKQIDNHVYTIVLVMLFTFGTVIMFFIYADLQEKSFARTRYEYETLRSYIDIPEEELQKLLYGQRITGSLEFVEAFEFEDKTMFIIENTGQIPLTGISVFFNETEVEPFIRPDLILPDSKDVIILMNRDIGGRGAVEVRTDQEVTLVIFSAGQ